MIGEIVKAGRRPAREKSGASDGPVAITGKERKENER